MTHHTISLPCHLEGHIAALAADKGVSFDAALTGALEAFFGFAEFEDESLGSPEYIAALRLEMEDRWRRVETGQDTLVDGEKFLQTLRVQYT